MTANAQSSAASGAPAGGAPAAARSELHRADVPGALDHASGEVDEFDAALVRGAGGVRPPAPLEDAAAPEAPPEERAATSTRPTRADIEPSGPAELCRRPHRARSEGEIAVEAEDERRPPPSGGAGAATGWRRSAAAAAQPEQAAGAPERGGNRAIGFLRASWAELQRVQWPDRRQVSQATAVVLGFVAVAGIYLGLADWVARRSSTSSSNATVDQPAPTARAVSAHDPSSALP